jgi:hypothetical protein
MSRRKIKPAYLNKISGAAIGSENTAGGSPCNYVKTYHLRPSRIGLPREILYREKACGLSGEVLATRPGSRQVLVQGRDLRRTDQEEVFPPDTEVRQMKAYPGLKPGIWGVVIGAAAISVLGFSSFGWTLGSTAERMAQERGQTAVVAVLAPICVEKFQHQADASAKLVEFNKVPSWDRRSIIEKGGWATMPGNDVPNSAVVTACAERLAGPL